MEPTRRVQAVVQDPKQAARAARLLLYCEFEPEDIEASEVSRPIPDGTQSISAALFALDNSGPAASEFPIPIEICGFNEKPAKRSTIAITVRCMNEGLARLASLLLHTAGAEEISTEQSNIG